MQGELESLSLFLFLPADRLDRLGKAVASDADAVILDLEDAVAPDRKDAARHGLAGALDEAARAKPIIVRVNAAGTQWHRDDLAAVAGLPLAGIMLPKAECPHQCETVRMEMGKPVLALVESALGVHEALSIARSADRIAFGNLDFSADVSAEPHPDALAYARSALVIASRVAGIPSPVDGVTKAFDDPGEVERDTGLARRMGFSGKLLIHPSQIAPARKAFLPSQNEIDWAKRVVEATKEEGGVVTLDGQMIDAPVVKRARQILARIGSGD